MAEPCPRCGAPDIDAPECPRCGVTVERQREYLRAMQPVLTASGPVVAAPPRRPAGFWVRAVALVIDYAAVQAARLTFRLAARALWGEGVESSRAFTASLGAFPALFGATYAVLFHWIWGQTFGKMVMRIRVTTVAGEPLSLGTSVLRELGFVMSVLTVGLGFLLAGIRADKRALHDLVAATRVARVE